MENASFYLPEMVMAVTKNVFMAHQCNWKHDFPYNKAHKIFQVFVQPCLMRPVKASKYSTPFNKVYQLCKVVMQPCVLRPVKASKYSSYFKMFHQTGSFNRSDTCSDTIYGKIDFISSLLT